MFPYQSKLAHRFKTLTHAPVYRAQSDPWDVYELIGAKKRVHVSRTHTYFSTRRPDPHERFDPMLSVRLSSTDPYMRFQPKFAVK